MMRTMTEAKLQVGVDMTMLGVRLDHDARLPAHPTEFMDA